MVDVGAEGRRSDGGIFRNSDIGVGFQNKLFHLPSAEPLPNEEEEIPFFLIGDAAFPLTRYLMRPYPGQVVNDIDKAVFNYRLSRARRTIENSFGIMAARWRIFRTTIIAELETVHEIVKASVCLHNFVLMAEENDPPENRRYCPTNFVDNELDGKIIPGEWRNIVKKDCGLVDATRLGANSYTKNAKEQRDLLSEYFMTSGAVPWQWKSVVDSIN